MGLNHPIDMEAWRRWERPSAAHRTVAALRRRGAPPAVEPLMLLAGSAAPRVLAVMDSASPSNRAAVLDPARRLPAADVAYLGTESVLRSCGVLTSGDSADAAAPETWDETSVPGSIERVLSIGAHLPAGSAASAWALKTGREQVVVQHGLLTPLAPPLPRAATALAFTAADGEFWGSGRTDLTVGVVGSQALWHAQPSSEVPEDDERPLVFLGQLHGRELPRRQIVGQTLGFLRAHPETLYRPHPSEKDLLSRTIHRAMKRGGIAFQDTAIPLGDSEADVVSVFSTGVLEAAQRGRRAWVHHDDPPPWILEFWGRYGLSRWGDEPTRPVRWAEREPAETIADYLRSGELRTGELS